MYSFIQLKLSSGAGGGSERSSGRPGPTRKESQGAQYRHHPLRARRRPPKGMHLDQEDIVSLSASTESGTISNRQLDTQLVSLKRQVKLVRMHTGIFVRNCKTELITGKILPILLQVQSIKQANSVQKRSLVDGIEAMRPAEVVSYFLYTRSLSHTIFFFILTFHLTILKFIMMLLLLA